jgi:hypothetical protein
MATPAPANRVLQSANIYRALYLAHPVDGLTVPDAAHIAGVPEADTAANVDTLIQTGMFEPAGPGRVRLTAAGREMGDLINAPRQPGS